MSRAEWQKISAWAWRMQRRRLVFEGQKNWTSVREPESQARWSRLGARARLGHVVSRRKIDETHGTIGWSLGMMKRLRAKR